MERLQKVIAQSGYTSRRNAEKLILEKKVKVNGKIISELGTKVDNKDIIEVEGKMLEKNDNKVYILLNLVKINSYTLSKYINELYDIVW